MRTIACLLLLLGVSKAEASMPPIAEKDAVISWVLERFWGNARDSSASPILPSSDIDRRTVPVSSSVAYRALEAGAISGLVQWCGLDWESHYFALTAAARKRGMSDKQVAFISVLHGLAQGETRKSKLLPCGENERDTIRGKIELSTSSGLKAPNTSLERTRAR